MRHAILIHAHHLPEQFGRLCRALSHPDFDIYANIDAKADLETFRRAAPNVTFIEKRIRVKWGHWSQVEATLNSLREITASGKEYGYVIFISGQDYPVQPLNKIARFLKNNKGTEFIEDSASGLDRKTRRKFEKRHTKHHVFFKNRPLSLAVNYALRLLPDKNHRLPFRKGSNWWNLSGDCVRYVLKFCDSHPNTVRSYKNTLCPDEIFFQSVIYASPFRGHIVNNNFRYVDWSNSKANPKTLGAADFDAITKSGAWFARKVDAAADPALPDMIDNYIKNGNVLV